jgi:hypothetical protein
MTPVFTSLWRDNTVLLQTSSLHLAMMPPRCSLTPSAGQNPATRRKRRHSALSHLSPADFEWKWLRRKQKKARVFGSVVLLCPPNRGDSGPRTSVRNGNSLVSSRARGRTIPTSEAMRAVLGSLPTKKGGSSRPSRYDMPHMKYRRRQEQLRSLAPRTATSWPLMLRLGILISSLK